MAMLPKAVIQKITQWPAVKLDPTQLRMWEDTLSALSWIAPGFVHIAYTMLNSTGNTHLALFTLSLPGTAATDGFQLIFNPQRFFKYNLMQRVFIVLHEIMHEILNHCRVSFTFRLAKAITVAGKSLPWDDDFANRIQDYVINAILIASKFGEFSKDWLYDVTIATDQDDWVSTYFRQWKNKKNICPPPPKPGQGKPGDQPGQGKPGPSEPGQGRFDCHLDPGEGTGKDPIEEQERNEGAWEQAVNTAMEIQRAQGKLPASMEKFFMNVLQPKVDWTEHIRGLIMRIFGAGAYDWRKLDRRLVTRRIGAPGMTGFGAKLVIIAYDTSGSIFVDPLAIDRFRGETCGIMEDVGPELCIVAECDAKMQKTTELTDPSDLRLIPVVKGGGGTDFRPVFKWIEDEGLEPDVLLYLTDGDGTFPSHAPEYPVIWGDISKSPQKYKWGHVVDVPNNPD